MKSESGHAGNYLRGHGVREAAVYHEPMNADSRSLAPSENHAGSLLREWREARRLSQLDLALDVGVSARHSSYVETGKSQPSRELLARLADALDMPLRERNALCIAAGFAPQLPRDRVDHARDGADRARHRMHPPASGALSCDRDESSLGRAAGERRRQSRSSAAEAAVAPKHGNVMRQVFDPEGHASGAWATGTKSRAI